MWIHKKITLLNPQHLSGTLLTRELLAEHQQALTILQSAEQQAQACLDAAHRQAEQLLNDARERSAQQLAEQIAEQQQTFLAGAEQLFADWQQQQQQWQAALLPRAEALLTQAMSQLLAEQPTEARLQAMLQQLLKAQGRQAAATLFCSPEQQTVVQEWLVQHPQLAWQISSDTTLPADSLLLTTEQGELHLSWSQLCAALLPVS
ncbi:type III secretion system stator protein SctL [Pantoea sp. BAV 3049]|uniref:type III secretion system stator protein SctL n=1 Tax=Pantoea sp. BAV 3049 TaxID=2654188 RepID=UPI00131C235D|nr:type III secretion system stator protein SctL [Pantoea sp. BAV 3049]